MEVVVSEKYVSKVLTDEKHFSFEQGVADVCVYLGYISNLYLIMV